MYLSKITAFGFKSFADKVTLHFQKNHITGVIGPNGSGKSNIIDSVRWVMGEQSAKTLRGEKSTDLIFSGSSKRSSLGMAEVSLFFDNSDYSPFCPAAYRHETEIVLSRRVYRDGSKEVSINGRVCRLKDLMEFFHSAGMGGKGYAIIQQGQIGDVLKAKPQELKETIEDIAGVLGFKVQIRESVQKLVKAKDNLARVDDLISEVVRQKEVLSKQVEACREHQNITASIHALERKLMMFRLKEATAQKASAAADKERLEEESQELSQKLTEISRELSVLKIEHDEMLSDLAKRKENLALLRENLAIKETSMENLQTLCEKSDYRMREYTASLGLDREALSNYKDKLAGERLEYTSLCKTRDAHKERFCDLEKDYRTAEERLSDSEKVLRGLEGRRADLKEKVLVAELSLKNIGERKEEVSCELADIQKSQATLEATVATKQIDGEAYALRLERLRKAVDLAVVELSKAKEEEQKLAVLVAKAQGKFMDLQCKKVSLESKKQLLEELISKDSASLREVSEAFCDGDAGCLLADHVFLQPASKELPEVVSDALSRWLGHICYVGESEGGVLESFRAFCSTLETRSLDKQDPIHSLRELHASFSLPESATEGMNHEKATPIYPKYVAIKTSSEGMNRDHLLRYMERVFVYSGEVSALSTEMLKGKVVILPSGVVLMGYTHRVDAVWYGDSSRSLLRVERDVRDMQASLDSVQVSLQKSEKELAELQKQTHNAVENIRACELQRDEARKVYQKEMATWNVSRRDLELATQATEESSVLARKHSQSLLELEQQKGELLAQVSVWKQSMEELVSEHSSVEQKHSGFSEALKAAAHQYEAIKVARAASESKVEILKKNMQQFEEYIATLEKNLKEKLDTLAHDKQEKVSNAELQSELRNDIAELLSQREDEQRYIGKMESVLSEVSEKLSVFSKKDASLQKQLTSIKVERERAVSMISSSLAQLEELKATCESQYEVSLEDLLSKREGTCVDSAVLVEELGDLKEKLSDLGAINFVAASEYDGLVEREGFLLQQKEELEKSLEVIKETIAEAQSISEKQFSDTFSLLSQEFSRLFPILFPGGSADLLLEEVSTESMDDLQNVSADLDDELSLYTQQQKGVSGVKIMVELPGKKRQPLALFSGGEKALTAIALVMAFLKTKPTPFCLLDEVDAPLDEANVFRYNQLLTALHQKFQFIVVTHNRKTMEVFDRLYGVTMQEPGVSKLVSVDLEKSLPMHLKKPAHSSAPTL